MKKIRNFLIYVFMGMAFFNFLGVYYFKTSNITAFTKYIKFCSENIDKLEKLDNREKVAKITKIYRSFEEKGITTPDKMISFHIKNIKQGSPLISTYYKIYQMGKEYDMCREIGEKIIQK